MSATDWFQKMVKAAEENLTLPESLNEASGGKKPGEEPDVSKTAAREAVSEKKASEQGDKPVSEEKEGFGGKEASQDEAAEEKAEAGEGEASAEAETELEELPSGAEAWALVAALQKQVAELTAREKALEAELKTEKDGRLADREEMSVKLELIKAGALDADYLAFKMGGEAAFDEEGNLLEADGFVWEAKKRYPALFRAAFPADIEGVKPGDGGMGVGRRPDTGFLTYSQEQRLRERR